MDRFRTLSTGPKLLLVATPLLFVSLFFTWQKLEVDFGRAGRAEALLDGWDFWGLLIGMLALGLTALAVVAYLTDVELSEDVPWGPLVLGGGIAILALTLLKNVTDADSAWASYVAVLLAALVALGAYETWAEDVGRPSLVSRVRRRGLRSVA
ncbi:MAG TPA: hypothetical protein VFB57_02290 [Gaiellaceae bacterium]|jgi:hypothetical protein|nr:hypothetical protein [Gaiellaceae bacterium]